MWPAALLADEDEIGRMFPDCELGAVPPVGDPYGLPVMVDDALAVQPDIYFEAGDHLSLLTSAARSSRA